MDAEKKMGPTEYQAELADLVRTYRMPSLEEVLQAVAEVREEYSDRILAARAEGNNEDEDHS